MAGRTLVTGGAIRIGRATATRPAAETFAIACHCRGSEDDAEALMCAVGSKRLTPLERGAFYVKEGLL